MNKKLFSICCMLAVIILMVTPYGVRMVFADGPTERITFYYSYFSGMPIGYGNWLPVITALLSIAILTLLLIGLKKDMEKQPVLVLLVICIVISLLSWLVFGACSIVGIIVMIFQVIAVLLQIKFKKHDTDIPV